MNLKNSKHSLNLSTSNKNEDNLQEPLTNINLQSDILCNQKPERVDHSLRKSFSDSELFISIKSIKKCKRFLSIRERSEKLIDSLKLQHGHSKTPQLNCSNEVTILHAGPELRQPQSKSMNASKKTNCNKQKPELKILFHFSFEPSEQVGQSANSTFGRHNNLQDRYKNRPIFLHYEENRIQLEVPDKLSHIQSHHNTPATKSDSTISESNKITNNVNSNLRKDNPQDQNSTIPINQIFDLSITNTFNEMHISNIIQGIIMVDIDKINCGSSRISQIRNCNPKTNNTGSTAMLRYVSQHVGKTNPPVSRPSTANKRICKRTNEIRKHFREISRKNTTPASNMSEKIFRKRIFRSKRTRNTSKIIDEKDKVKRERVESQKL